jgi:hypothetical protein
VRRLPRAEPAAALSVVTTTNVSPSHPLVPPSHVGWLSIIGQRPSIGEHLPEHRTDVGLMEGREKASARS